MSPEGDLPDDRADAMDDDATRAALKALEESRQWDDKLSELMAQSAARDIASRTCNFLACEGASIPA